ncbi:MAG TPA: TspO/MBR family protein [Dongiaceae bacterium]|nr:TspO/MBR family protein [Dongiaceae bacterium]
MMQRSTAVQVFGLFGWLLLVFVAAGVGAVATIDAAAFYEQLARPTWAPPAFVFGPVWSCLYFLMGVAAWLVWRTDRNTKAALALFVIQLGANTLWSWLFFAWHLGQFAFIEILILLVLILATILVFWRYSRKASALMVPYLAWVGFASLLTWSIWQANPQTL